MLLALYFVVPLDRSDAIPIGASLALALVVLLGVAVWQMKATIRSSHPPIRAVEALGVTVLLVEQNAFGALSVADRGYVMETGRITMSGPAVELIADERIRAAYLGI